MEDSAYYLLLLGIVIVIMTLLRRIGQKTRQNAIKQKEKEAALKAAKVADRKSQAQANFQASAAIPPKSRMPVAAHPLGTPFVGGVQGHAARWEAEIHQLGRQIIGQIDSKMAALQAITIDANRTANRLEILVEHLEQIAQEQIERQQAMIRNAETSAETDADTASPSAVLPAAEAESTSDAAPLTEVLQELAEDLEGIHQKIQQSTTLREEPTSATVLRIEELQTTSIRGEVEMLANYGIEPLEIAQRLNISVGEVDLILQASVVTGASPSMP
ncbi:MAG: hypothetical protein FWG73_08115 [Planctomycetaceae bacterium]|nr:hypothetical protein [Planctomycetaceae bacterium]